VANFFSGLAFIGGIALMVLLAEPPGVIVAIIAVVLVGVLLTTHLTRSVNARSRRPVGLAHLPVSAPVQDALYA